MTELRLLSYNVHGQRDDTYALHGLVRDLAPDVMCVQEAPKYFRWRSRVAALARECGLFYVSGGGTTGGTALLVHLRVAVERRAEMALSSRFGWPDRGVAAAVIRVGGVRLAVASLHLPLPARSRLGQSRRALDVLRLGGVSTMVAAGDLNERPSGPVWAYFDQEGLRDLGKGTGPTYPAIHPDRRIDGAFATSDVELVDYRVVDDPRVRRASDHRPILATVRLPTPTTPSGS